MIRRLLCGISLFLTAHAGAQISADGEDRAPANAVPIYDVAKGFDRKFRTQLDIMLGTGNVYAGQKSQPSTAVTVKGIHHVSGALYVASGGGFTYLCSENRPEPGSGALKQFYRAWLLTLPTGVGFSIGDDNATVITGVDVLPGYYVKTTPTIEGEARRFTWGIGPEFGFMLKVGRARQRGIYMGMTGKIQWLQSPGIKDGPGLRYGFAGAGLCMRF